MLELLVALQLMQRHPHAVAEAQSRARKIVDREDRLVSVKGM